MKIGSTQAGTHQSACNTQSNQSWHLWWQGNGWLRAPRMRASQQNCLSTRFVLKDVLRLCLRLDQPGKETMTSLAVRAQSATADATNATLFGSIELWQIFDIQLHMPIVSAHACALETCNMCGSGKHLMMTQDSIVLIVSSRVGGSGHDGEISVVRQLHQGANVCLSLCKNDKKWTLLDSGEMRTSVCTIQNFCFRDQKLRDSSFCCQWKEWDCGKLMTIAFFFLHHRLWWSNCFTQALGEMTTSQKPGAIGVKHIYHPVCTIDGFSTVSPKLWTMWPHHTRPAQNDHITPDWVVSVKNEKHFSFTHTKHESVWSGRTIHTQQQCSCAPRQEKFMTRPKFLRKIQDNA